MTLENAINLLLLSALGAGGFGAWRLNRRLKAFKAMLPELKAEIDRLNTGIATAQGALSQMRREAVRIDAPTSSPVRSTPARGHALRSLVAAMRRDAA